MERKKKEGEDLLRKIKKRGCRWERRGGVKGNGNKRAES